MATQLDLAEAQLIGFVHASKGHSILNLVESMGMTRSEWIKLRDKVPLKALDKEDIDKKFGL